jgi:hypothetical protein
MTPPLKSPADVRAEWQKRRTRRFFAIGVAVTVQLLLLALFFLARTKGEAPPFPIFFIIPPLVLIGFLKWNRRCPACGEDPRSGVQPFWRIKNCKNCGAQLRD